MNTTLRTVHGVAALVALSVIGAFGAAHANHYILPCREKCGDVGVAPAVTIPDVGLWTAIGPDGANVVALVIDPATPTTAFAGTLGAGVLKTADGGVSWATASAGISSANVSALAIDPSTPSTLYAGTDAGVFKSTDGGFYWVPVNGGLPAAPQAAVKAIAVDPTAPATVYAGTTGGLFKTLNGGMNWTAIGADLTGLSPVLITIDPSSPSTLYLGVEAYQDDAHGLLKSTDGGTSWARIYTSTPFGDGGAPAVTALAIDPRSSSRLYLIAGALTKVPGGYRIGDALLISSDGGATWSRANLSPPYNRWADSPISLTIDPSTPTTIYVGTASGLVARSTDAGDHWTFPTNGPRLSSVNALRAATSGSPTLYAGGRNGISRSADQATTWTQLTLGVRTVGVGATVVDPVAPSTIYSDAGGVLVKTTDGGAHWLDASLGLPNQRFSLLAIDPLSSSTVYALGDATYKSADDGAHWEPLQFFGAARAFAIAPSQPSTVYVGMNSVGIVKSLDGGRSISYVSDGFSPVGRSVSAIAVDPTTPHVVYVASAPTGRPTMEDAKILKSTDGAAHFRQIPIAVPAGSDITSIVIDPTMPSVIYATYADFGDYGRGGVFKSVDSGETWAAAESGLLPTWIWTLVVDPSLPSRLYAATNAGVFRSTDGGQTWRLFNSGLGTAAVYHLSIDRSGSLLRASSAFGLYEYKVLASTTPGTAIANQHGLTGFWYEPATTGQGFAVEMISEQSLENGRAFVSWFTYDSVMGGPEHQRWYTLQGSAVTGQLSVSLTINQNTGGNFNAPPTTTAQGVGTAILRFDTCSSGELTYSFNDGGNGTIPLTRMLPNVTCSVTPPHPVNADFALSGNWYAPATSGQGMTVEINPKAGALFAAWSTYAPNGANSGADGQRWYTVQGAFAPALRTIPVQIYESTGGIFDTPTPPGQKTVLVGTGTMTFQSCSAATFDYNLTGGSSINHSGTMSLVRVGPVPAGCTM